MATVEAAPEESNSTENASRPSSAPRRPLSFRFPFAEPADILRAAHKDEYYKQNLRAQVFDVLRQWAGPRLAMSYKEEVNVVSDAVYYSIHPTTLGEEYCDIMAVRGDSLTRPATLTRTLLLVWHLVIPYTYQKLLRKLQNMSNADQLGTGTREQHGILERIPPEQRELLLRALPHLTAFLSILERVHLAVFYFSGSFYHISRRLVNLRYIFIRPSEERPSYSLLGLLIFAQLAISLILFLRQLIQRLSARERNEEDERALAVSPQEDRSLGLVTNPGKCSLCLSERTNPTATPCGHIFCWHCVLEWSNTKTECPLCRTPLTRNELLPVYGL